MPVVPTVQPSGEEDTIKADARLTLEACGRDSSPNKAQRSSMCTKPRAHLPVQARATCTPWASVQPSPGWAVRRLGFPPGPDGRAGAHPAAPGAGHLAPATPGCGDRAPAQAPMSRERAHQRQAKVLEGQGGWSQRSLGVKCPDVPGTVHCGSSRVGDRSAVCAGGGVGTKQDGALSV